MSRNAFVALFSALLAGLLAIFVPTFPLWAQAVASICALALLIVAGNFWIRALADRPPRH